MTSPALVGGIVVIITVIAVLIWYLVYGTGEDSTGIPTSNVTTSNVVATPKATTSNVAATPKATTSVVTSLYPEGSFIGVGKDNYLYSAKSLDNSFKWVKIPGSEGVRSITQLKNGSFLIVNTNNDLELTSSLTSMNWIRIPWQPPSSGSTWRPTHLMQLKNGSILGWDDQGLDESLKVTNSLDPLKWEKLVGDSNTCRGFALSEISLLRDGLTVLGIFPNYEGIYKSPSINNKNCKWAALPETKTIGSAIVSLIQLKDGSFLSVNTDNTLYTAENEDKIKTWKQILSSCCVTSVIQLNMDS